MEKGKLGNLKLATVRIEVPAPPIRLGEGEFVIVWAAGHQIQVHVIDGQAVVCVHDTSIIGTFEDAGY